MNYLMFLWKLKAYFLKALICLHIKDRPKISILIPFSSSNPNRRAGFEWLLQYWKYELPDAEVIIGKSRSKVFCKGEALNDAASRATGAVFVIMDADAYIEGFRIEHCADRILEELILGQHLWYVPYRNLYRLTKKATDIILNSDPKCPFQMPSPPPKDFVESGGHTSKYGHRYGAMCMIFPREAYDVLGCFDERFKGWGSEDIALLRALDTLWGKHKTTKNDILHLWHPFIGNDYLSRMWEGQKSANPNSNLAIKYHKASRHPSQMRQLVDEGCQCQHKCKEYVG